MCAGPRPDFDHVEEARLSYLVPVLPEAVRAIVRWHADAAAAAIRLALRRERLGRRAVRRHLVFLHL